MLTIERMSSTSRLALRSTKTKGREESLTEKALASVGGTASVGARNLIDVLPEIEPLGDELFARLHDPRGVVEKPIPAQDEWAKATTTALRSRPEWPALVEASSFHPLVARTAASDLVRVVAQDARLLERAIHDEKNDALADVKAALEQARAQHDHDVATFGVASDEAQASGDAVADLAARAAKISGKRKVASSINIEHVAANAKRLADKVRFMGGFSPTGTANLDSTDIERFPSVEEIERAIDMLGGGEQANGERDAIGVSEAGVVVGVTVGGDVRRLIPVEASRLALRSTRSLAFKALLDEEAIVYDVADDEPKRKRGPIVVCVDRSGSMNAPDMPGGASRISVAKGLALVVLRRAVAQRREIVVVVFESTARRIEGSGTALAKAIVDLASGGGTSFPAAFTEAAKAIEGMKGEPDVLVISDAESTEIADARAHLSANVKAARAVLFHVGSNAATIRRDEWDDVVRTNEVLGSAKRVLGALS